MLIYFESGECQSRVWVLNISVNKNREWWICECLYVSKVVKANVCRELVMPIYIASCEY